MNKAAHIVVMRLSAMGDVAMLVPVLRGLFEAQPELKVTLVSRPFFEPLFDEFDRLEFFGVDLQERHKGLAGLFRLYKDLKRSKPDGFADLHNVLRSKVVGLLFRLSGKPVAVLNKGRAEKKALTRKQNKILKPLKHTTERYAEVFHRLGFACQPIASQKSRLPLPLEIREFLPADRRKAWIGLAPFASFPGKTYPLNQMKELCLLLSKDYEVLLFSAPGKETETISDWENPAGGIYSMRHLGSLQNELIVIGQLDLMISMDSANGHLAANFGVEVCTIWGLTHPYAGFGPVGQDERHWVLPDLDRFPLIPTSIYGNKVPDGYEKVMSTMSPESIYARVKTLLS